LRARFRNGRAAHRDYAQVLVEAAIVFPLVIVVALGLVQFALFEHAQNVVMAAAEDGARVAASEGATELDGQQRALQLLHAGLGTYAVGPQANVAFLPAGVSPPDRVQVRVTAKLRSIVPIPLGDGTLPLAATASMSKEHFRAGP
jgi:Flp pilus assembly protein TadG